jgi:uncharacterized protein (DUF58 family)
LQLLRAQLTRRPTIVLLSDFRDPDLSRDSPRFRETRRLLRELSRRCDIVAIALTDPREEELPRAGMVVLEDPEDPGSTLVLDTSSPRVRRRYQRAFTAWRLGMHDTLRSGGVEALWLRLDHDPLHALGRFFEQRMQRRQRVRA